MPLLLGAVLMVAAVSQIGGGAGGGRTSSSGGKGAGGAAARPSSTATVRPRQPAQGARRGRDGKLEFTVLSVSCGRRTVGEPPLQFSAAGQFCLVRVQVRNIGTQSWKPSINQYLIDTAGDRHVIDLRGGLAVSSQRLLEQLEPGRRVTGTLVFDLPRTVRPAKLVFHDSLLSGGVTIPVPRG